MISAQYKIVQSIPEIHAFYVDSELPAQRFPGLRIHEEVDWESILYSYYYHDSGYSYYSAYSYYYYFDLQSTVISRKYACIHLGRSPKTDWLSPTFIYMLVAALGFGVEQETRFHSINIWASHLSADPDTLGYADVAALANGDVENRRFILPAGIGRMTVNTSLVDFAIPYSGEETRRKLSKAVPENFNTPFPINFLVIGLVQSNPAWLTGEAGEATTSLTLDLTVDEFEWNPMRGPAV